MPKSIRIDYDKDYGIYLRSGWSISINGHYYCQFRRLLLIALLIAIWKRGREIFDFKKREVMVLNGRIFQAGSGAWHFDGDSKIENKSPFQEWLRERKK